MRLGGRLWVALVSAVALAVAGWAVMCGSTAAGARVSTVGHLACWVLAMGLTGGGVAVGWRGLTRSRFVITVGAGLRRLVLTVACLLWLLSALQVGNLLGWTGADAVTRIVLALMVVLLVFQVPVILVTVLLLVGGPRGLTFWRRQGAGVTRVPWADIERVVFSSGLVANTIEIGVALRAGAKPRRSSTRRHDVLTDLPCRVVVPRKSFDVAGLQRLVAAHPQVELVERAAGMERVWQPAGVEDGVWV